MVFFYKWLVLHACMQWARCFQISIALFGSFFLWVSRPIIQGDFGSSQFTLLPAIVFSYWQLPHWNYGYAEKSSLWSQDRGRALNSTPVQASGSKCNACMHARANGLKNRTNLFREFATFYNGLWHV